MPRSPGLWPALLIAIAASTACAAGAGAAIDRARLEAEVARVAEGARPGLLGVGVAVLGTSERWSVRGDHAFPMQSVFKAPLGAMVFDLADRGALRLDSTLVLRQQDLSVTYSPVADSFPARTAWTVDELLVRAV